MYYPYLRARQFELISLRELAAEEATQGVVIPIFEPVKRAFNNFVLANTMFVDKNQRAYLIVNPIVGEEIGDGKHYLDHLAELDSNAYSVAFHYHSNIAYIQECIESYNLEDCLLICQNDTSAEDLGFKELANINQITAFNVEDPGKNRSLNRFLRTLGKNVIRLDDPFEKQARNSDFLSISDHRFSEEHLYFEDEQFNGFSDYTVLPSEFVEGGSTPRAVVIHFTYLNAQNQIWIRHFTSETNDSIANVQGKFAEAARKTLAYCQGNGFSNSAIEELNNLVVEEHYPGLGTVKKLSIKNHILVLSNYLKNR
jgi:hypothetical protein